MNNEVLQEELKKVNNKKTIRLTLIISLLTFLIGAIIGLKLSSTYSLNNDLEKVVKILKEEWYSEIYYGEEDEEVLIEQFISRVANRNNDYQLDPYTYLVKNVPSVSRARMGISISRIFGYPYIVNVEANSPAEVAGVQEHDIILGLEKEGSTYQINDPNISYNELTSLMSGEEGEVISLNIYRPADKNYLQLNVRLTKTIPSVSAYVVNASLEDTLMVKLTGFVSDYSGDYTYNQFKKILEENTSSNLIIDLRDNGGGSVDSVINICDLFLPKSKKVLTMEYKDKSTKVYQTKDNQSYEFEKIVLLINQNTASASEIMTSCLSYYLPNVTLVGTKTFGKGIAQLNIPINGEYNLQYTHAKWYCADGSWIHNVLSSDDNSIKADININLDSYNYFLSMANYSNFNYPDYDVSIDSVTNAAFYSQRVLNYLYDGLSLRTDGYFDVQTQDAIIQFQKDYDLEETGTLTEEVFIQYCCLFIEQRIAFNEAHINSIKDL